jgi:hypothetical protein
MGGPGRCCAVLQAVACVPEAQAMTHTILIIRHAEKPEHGHHGIDSKGNPDRRSLTPRGWQRAGAWTELFAPSLSSPVLPVPGALFASAPAKLSDDPDASKSERSLQTLTPLSKKLGIPINIQHSKGEEPQLARAICAVGGIVLVSWQHESIAAILKALTPEPAGYPTAWPDDRFNLLFELTRSAAGAPWKLRQLSPVMLSHDDSHTL